MLPKPTTSTRFPNRVCPSGVPMRRSLMDCCMPRVLRSRDRVRWMMCSAHDTALPVPLLLMLDTQMPLRVAEGMSMPSTPTPYWMMSLRCLAWARVASSSLAIKGTATWAAPMWVATSVASHCITSTLESWANMSRVKFALQGKCRVQNRTLQVRARATEPTVCAAAASTGLPAAGDMMRWRVQECAHRHVQLECPSRGTLRPRTGSSLAPWDPAWCTAPSV
mmetsp:Transcript_5545/g.15906  ORF Transcript_5545/g.15906 Transcript_5545/m.15906 type:complete len:222 (-) Transcript_5545:431-1096(-)